MSNARDARVDAAQTLYAQVIAAGSGALREQLEAALATVPRERFLPGPPWYVSLISSSGPRFIEINDPIHLYQNLLIALDRDKGINNGEPALHAMLLGALAPEAGETVLHIGCGTGYYTAILAELVSASGSVLGYEIEPALAAHATTALAAWPRATVAMVSGTDQPLPEANCIYVNAGATRPHAHWLDALKDGGRLVFPLTSGGKAGWGASMRILRDGDRFAARVISPSGFISCVGATDDAEGKRVTDAFQSGHLFATRSLLRDNRPDETAVLVGDGWWLSSRPLDA